MKINRCRNPEENTRGNFASTPAGAGLVSVGAFPGKICAVLVLAALLAWASCAGALGQEAGREKLDDDRI